jgi:cytochrome c peroxidase
MLLMLVMLSRRRDMVGTKQIRKLKQGGHPMTTKFKLLTAYFFPFILISSLLLVGCEPAAVNQAAKSTPYELQVPLGLNQYNLEIPEDNPMTAEKIELGRLLYFDKRLSIDDTVSCATCHAPESGFSDGKKTSVGVRGQTGARNAPTVINRAFSTVQFWDGRAASLEEQAKGPVMNPIEMAMPSHEVIVEKLTKIQGYKPLFARAFGTDQITIDRVAQAIAAFERTVLSGNSPFDKYQAGDRTALSEAARRGFDIFEDKAACRKCHSGFNFTDEKYHNLGVGWDPKTKKLKDEGRIVVTKNQLDKGAFKTPTLREIARTAPYMHDGSLATLEEVVELYNKGGEKNPFLDKDIKPLKLTPQEKADLVEFLKALSGEGWQQVQAPASFPQ